MNETSLFHEEEEIVREAEELLANDSRPEISWPTRYKDLLSRYRRLLGHAKRLVSIGDLIQKDLNDRNEQLRSAQKREDALRSQLVGSRKMEAIGTLAGGFAHDFNNILAIIIGYSELAQLNLPEMSKEYRNIDDALKGCYRARDLVRQILVFSRMEGAFERQPLDLASTVTEVFELLRPTLPDTVEIRWNIPEKKFIVPANRTQMHQLLIHLCTNAAHAMEEAGGILQVSLSEVNLDADAVPADSVLNPGSYIKLTVGDTGQGMDPWTLERVFDPYFTTKEIGKGSGLGLSLAQGIAKRHGGAVRVKSEPGKGSIFDVYLPLSEV